MIALPRWLSRMLGGIEKRGLDAAAAGRRWSGAKKLLNLNTEIAAGGATVRQRGAYYARNNPWLAKGLNSLIAAAIGTGIKPLPKHPDEGQCEKLAILFDRWSDAADVTGRTDFYGLQAQAFRGMAETGEAFSRFLVTPDVAPIPFQLQMIASDQVDPTVNRNLENGRVVRAGIEMDGNGRRLAYHVLPNRPGDLLTFAYQPVEVPATEMLHVFDQMEAGQVRGLSWLAPVLLRLQELDVYEDAQLVRQKIAALFAGFIVSPDGDAAGFEGTRDGSALDTGLEPGTLKTLPPGTDIRFSDPAEVGDSHEFVKSQLRAIASGLGITYEQLTGDLSDVNYSSIRAGILDFRRRIDLLRWSVFIPQFCKPVWEHFIRMAVLAGRIPADEFARNPDAYLAVEWHPPAWDWVDPEKDVRAEILAVGAGFKARSMVINERGNDPARIDTLIAADRRRAEKLGNTFVSGAAPVPPTNGGSDNA